MLAHRGLGRGWAVVQIIFVCVLAQSSTTGTSTNTHISTNIMTFHSPSPTTPTPHTSTSLYIPGFEPQPVSADVLGVDSAGRTTWVLHSGTKDASNTRSYAEFIGTATLVEGAHDASLTYADAQAGLTLGIGCTLSAVPQERTAGTSTVPGEFTLAICTIVQDASTAVQSEPVVYYPVQGASRTLSPSVSLTSSSPTFVGSVTEAPATLGPTDAPETSMSQGPGSGPFASSAQSAIRYPTSLSRWAVRFVLTVSVGIGVGAGHFGGTMHPLVLSMTLAVLFVVV